MRATYLAFIFIVFTALGVTAQMVVFPSNDIPVYTESGSLLRNPWTGGINAAHISTFDIYSQGLNKDLFVFDKAGDRILLFEGVDEAGIRKYQFVPDKPGIFPTVREWALLRDFNCDGKQDLFTYSPLGGSFSAYRNTSEQGGLFEFIPETEMILSLYQFSSNSFTTNIYVSTQDMPGISDFDGDGDLDILTFSVGGTSLEYHENFSMDNDGICSLQGFKLRNRCYGQFSEGSETNTITLGDPCSFNVVDPKDNRHIGSTILSFDGNGDGLHDIVLGDVTFSNLTFLENSEGTLGMDSIVSVDAAFPSTMGNLPVALQNFPAPFYEDVDGDGVRDLLITTNSNSFSENRRSIWLYHNSGADDVPFFEFVQPDFLQNETIDTGEYTSVAFFDFTGNGLMDMVIGSRGEFQGSEQYIPVLALYVNTGTASVPSFQEVNSNWLDIGNLGIDSYPHCTFGDLDADGDMDLVIGDFAGVLHLLENTATPGTQAVFNYEGLISANGSSIDVGQQSTPQLYDLNDDGLLDIIVGERIGNINYYKNEGTASAPSFSLVTENLGDVDTTDPELFIGSSAPHFFEYEGEKLLLTGTESGKCQLYTGIDGNELGTYTLFSAAAYGIDAGRRSRAVIMDVNSDSYPDIFSGCIGGGVLYYKGAEPTSTNNSMAASNRLQIFPNPADGEITVAFHASNAAPGSVRIYDLSGRLVHSGSLPKIGVSHLAPGMYLLQVEGNRSASALFIKK